MTPTIITEPTTEPVSLIEAKNHLRVDSNDEDALILSYVKAARRYVEWYTGRAILTQTLEIVLDRFPDSSDAALRLPRATPLVSVTSIKYTDSDAVETTWSSSLYQLDTDNYPGSVKPAYNESWPSFTPAPVNPIRIRYVAGSSTATENLTTPILLLTERLFDHRSDVLTGERRMTSLPYGIESYLQQARVEYLF